MIDAVLLAMLLWAAFTHRESLVSVLGPIHGPPGSLIGDVICRRRLAEADG